MSQHLQVADDVLRVNFLVNSRNNAEAERKATALKEEADVIQRQGKAIFAKTWHIVNTRRTGVLKLPEEKPKPHDMKLLCDTIDSRLVALKTQQRRKGMYEELCRLLETHWVSKLIYLLCMYRFISRLLAYLLKSGPVPEL